MSFYGLLWLLFGWLMGFCLAIGAVTFYADGHTDPLTQGAGVALLALWAWDVRRWMRRG